MLSSSRGKAKVRVLAVHTTEGIMRAADLKAWKSWAGSSHASADETGVLLTPDDGFVSYDLAAWTLRSGNAWSENIELCAFAKWKRADWLARPKLLDRCAYWLAVRAVARGIPLVKLTPAEYRAGKAGVIGHHDHTVGYSDGTHWDPGRDFPWDVVIAAAQTYSSGKTKPPQAPTSAAPAYLPLEDPVNLPAGETVHLTVPAVPAGCKAVLVVSTDSVSGARIYSKAVTRVEGKSIPLLEGAGDWTKWLAPGFRDERDVTQYHSVELVNNAEKSNPAALASAVISVVPA